MSRHDHPAHANEPREKGPGPGPDLPRWPGAPRVEDGADVRFTCDTCGEDSTLVYRCSECGAEPGENA